MRSLYVHFVRFGTGASRNIGARYLVENRGCAAPTWTVSWPLEIVGSAQGNEIYVRADDAADMGPCETTATVTASTGGCSQTMTVTVKKQGPITIEQTGSTHTCYTGSGPTFRELGVPLPTGSNCTLDDKVFGCVRKLTYSLCAGACPLENNTFVEDFEDSELCPCAPRDQANAPGPAPMGCVTIWDTYGVLDCSCTASRFLSANDFDCHTLQTYSVNGCVILQKCLHQVRTSPNGTCGGFEFDSETSAPIEGTCPCQPF